VRYRTKEMDKITLVPRPLYNTEVWQPVASGNPRSLEFMAKHGIKALMAMIDLKAEVDPLLETYTQFSNKHGRDIEPGGNAGLYLYTHVGESRESAIAEIEKFQQESFKRTAGIGGNPTEKKNLYQRDSFELDQLKRLGDRNTAARAAAEMGYRSLDDRSKDDDQYLFGSADKIITTLKEIEERYPALETIVLHPPELTWSTIMMEQMERFAEEVLPAFPEAIHKDRSWPDKLADQSKLKRYLNEPTRNRGTDPDTSEGHR
jgi:alkanesulfonate monooxygenase SsuD/methylene tetrahydromethanopterin reductase-like flavin-dependent oxidoreductase (luciferase family)